MRKFEFTLRDIVERVYQVTLEDDENDLDPNELGYEDVKDRGKFQYSITVAGSITHREEIVQKDIL